MTDTANHYDVLGVSAEASEAVIRAAYKARMRETHPDAGGDQNEAKAVNEAFAVLGDPGARAAYDRDLRATHPQAPQEEPESPAAPATGVRPHTPAPAPIEAHEPAPFSSYLPQLLIGGGIIAAAAMWAVIANLGNTTVALVALVACATATLLPLPRKWWLTGAATAAIGFFTISEAGLGIAGYALVASGVLASGAGFSIRSRMRTERALQAVDRYFASAARDGIEPWFVQSAAPDGPTTTVLLAHTEDPSHQVSASVWGRAVPGQYISLDPTGQPAVPQEVVSTVQMRRAARARRKQNR